MNYNVLNKQVFLLGKYSLVPIRFQDRYLIMQWRNEQMYHLRQNKLLTEADQDAYFDNVIAKLFEQENPAQILFSFLEGNQCIGYGGLVHINWIDKHSELSFIMDTQIEKMRFEQLWSMYLSLIKEIAFKELGLHKIYTFAFDLRPHLYPVLEKNGFFKDAVLKQHCYFQENFIDVVIHGIINKNQKSHVGI